MSVPNNSPQSLCQWAVDVLNTADPAEKVRKTFLVSEMWKSGKILDIGTATPPDEPPRDSFQVLPRSKTGKRGKGGTQDSRIAILHALANIEQWAIDLAWDIIARFSSIDLLDDLLREFCSDFIKVAADEAKHFSLLKTRIEELGSYYGSHPIHAGLWDSAQKTSHDVLSRLAIVHMVHEARGLDVNPQTISKFERSSDEESVRILRIIHEDEITHVGAGHKWFDIISSHISPDINKIEHFQSIVRDLFNGPLRPPFNAADR